jgi:dolichyl-phosphate beta-glucosyltransferase
MSSKNYSIIIPAYNEEQRIVSTIQSIAEYFQERKADYEIIVVDDGSSDKTAQVVRGLAQENPQIELIQLPQNCGKGVAVKTGMLRANKNFALYTDADGASPISELGRLENAIYEGADLAIGSRAVNSEDTVITTAIHRKLMGSVFNFIANFLLVPGIRDTQCGFKLFTKQAREYIFPRQQVERFCFDVELLLIAKEGGFKIAEVPINWTNIAGSKVNLIGDSLQMFFDMLKIKLGRILKKRS